MNKELTDKEILEKATEWEVGNGYVFASVTKTIDTRHNLNCRNIAIVKIKEDQSTGRAKFELLLSKAWYSLDTKSVGMSNMGWGLLSTTNLPDAQKIAQAIVNSELAY